MDLSPIGLSLQKEIRTQRKGRVKTTERRHPRRLVAPRAVKEYISVV